MDKPKYKQAPFSMDYVPEPKPENYWWLDLNDPRAVMVDQIEGQLVPVLTLIVREIQGNKVALQIVASSKISNVPE